MTERRALHVHISEPYHFETANGTSELIGWSHTPEDEGEWIVQLERHFYLGDQGFDKILVSPRYVGDTLAGLADRILGIAINIRHWHDREWQFGMIGTLSPHREPS